MFKESLNVLIVGAGKIGAEFDRPNRPLILTHAHAFSCHIGFSLVGFVDTDIVKCRTAAAIWGGKAYATIDEAFVANEIDVVSVAVPDEYHFPVLMDIAKRKVKIVFAEKPLATTSDLALKVCTEYAYQGISLCVNYTRRFVPEFEAIRKNIHGGIFGEYLTGTGYYGKGILHNGSHIIDLIRFLISDIQSQRSLSSLVDFYPMDPSINAILTLANNAPFLMQVVDCRQVTVFEIDLYFSKKRIRIIDSGFKIEEYDVACDPVYKGYNKMTKTNEIKSSLPSALFIAVNGIYEFVNRGIPLQCSGQDALDAIDICEKLSKSLPVMQS